MKLNNLATQILSVDAGLKTAAGRAVNRMLTVRNWLIGYYIVHYEQHGEDRAQYGEKLLDTLATQLQKAGLKKGLDSRRLRECRTFFTTYPQIWQSLSAVLQSSDALATVSQEFRSHTEDSQIRQTASAKFPLPKATIRNKSETAPQTPPDLLISRLSFSHLVELLPVAEPLKRAFYELEAIKGAWSVRELRRQIDSLYFERSGMSVSPELLSQKVQSALKPQKPEDIVKDVYTFEFLGLPQQLAIEESDLESALLDHLQSFILELGRGFCFEGRQQRILIGEKYYFIDLVFYNRILKCHMLIELKVAAFDHADAGQLNTYLNYYKKEVAEPDDNPPIGILLVTNKDDALVEYATAGMDPNLFVKKYLLQLPSTEQLADFIRAELKNIKS